MPTRGLYETLLTDALASEHQQLDKTLRALTADLRDAEAADRFALHVARIVRRTIETFAEKGRAASGGAVVRELIAHLALSATGVAGESPHDPPTVLKAIARLRPDGEPETIDVPLTPLLDTTLFTNAPGEPHVGGQVASEIRSADRIDIVMAFVRRSGINPFVESLKSYRDDGRKIRVLTTTYTGSTEPEALDLLQELGADVRVSYDTSTTRLHAKAWLFHRESGFSTAYVGSSNLTHSAQVSGLEWNVRVSGARNPDVIQKINAVFESYWANPDFEPYDRDVFKQRAERGPDDFTLPPTELRLEPFQERMLEQIAIARRAGRHQNLLVSATGTGKTVMAAMDYVRLRDTLPRLLFVAHREEILARSQATFRHALRDHAFGELWVGRHRPDKFTHVFASIQSLSAAGESAFAPDHFDVVIVDEFHHAAADSYKRLLEHLKPTELLALTATPERADGLPILDWFDGRIAAELRLWDAIDQQRLAPFHYYGIHDGVNLTEIRWTRGGYDLDELTNVLTRNDAWAHLVIKQIDDHVGSPKRMRALGFCVSVAHAKFMARVFNKAGIAAVSVSADTPDHERHAALRDLADRKVNIVFSVDLFNEGVDIPAVDTLLLLRPTDSATLFLQQLGRGLRKSHDKSACTVLDFVGQHRAEFRFDLKLRALLGGTRADLEKQVEGGFPFLPAGCHMQLDPVARKLVLDNIRNAVPTRWKEKVAELKASKRDPCTLSDYLRDTGLELDDVYDGAKSWSDLKADAGLRVAAAGPHEEALRRACGRFLHVDDPIRIDAWTAMLRSAKPPALTSDRDYRLLQMLVAPMMVKVLVGAHSLESGAALLWQHPQVRAELVELLEVLRTRMSHLTEPLETHPDVPLSVHAQYSRIELLAAFRAYDGAKVASWQTGVRWLPDAKTDLFAFTLDKTSGEFSPTTRYRDYAVSPELIHWESQSVTRAASTTGQRYQHHKAQGSHVMLCARERADQRAFTFLGPAEYVSHTGEMPMAITWRLTHRLPGDLFAAYAAAVA